MNGQKNKRAKACNIPKKVKDTVHERDTGLCVLCDRPGYPNAHFISRAHGGLGIEENIVTLCLDCHNAYDHGDKLERDYIRGKLRYYLSRYYPGWNEDSLIYRKQPDFRKECGF